MAGQQERLAGVAPPAPKTTVVAVAPWPLNSLAEICRAFDRSRRTVVDWYHAGAPIAAEGQGSKKRYQAEYNALMGWLTSRKSPS